MEHFIVNDIAYNIVINILPLVIKTDNLSLLILIRCLKLFSIFSSIYFIQIKY